MCIRDRAYLVAKDENGKKAVYQIGISKGERFKAKASLYSKKAMENYRSNGIHTVIRKSLIKLEAVSYTHLDVYKRQR